MENQYNKNLYWYGVKAKMKAGAGAMLMTIGLMVGLVLLLVVNAFIAIIVGLAISGYGMYLISQGKAMRFDYQRQSGTVMHKGDWD